MSKVGLSELQDALETLESAQKKAQGVYKQAKLKIGEAYDAMRLERLGLREEMQNTIAKALFLPISVKELKLLDIAEPPSRVIDISKELGLILSGAQQKWPTFSTGQVLKAMSEVATDYTEMVERVKIHKEGCDISEGAIKAKQVKVQALEKSAQDAEEVTQNNKSGPSKHVDGFFAPETTIGQYPRVRHIEGWEEYGSMEGADVMTAAQTLAVQRAAHWDSFFKEEKFLWMPNKRAKEARKELNYLLEKTGMSFDQWLLKEAKEDLWRAITANVLNQENNKLQKMTLAKEMEEKANTAKVELPKKMREALAQSIQKQLKSASDLELMGVLRSEALPMGKATKLDQVSAKERLIEKIKYTTEEKVRKINNEMSKTEARLAKISKAKRRSSSLSVDVDAKAIKEAAKSLAPQAHEWLKQVGVVLSGVAQLPEQKEIALSRNPKLKDALRKLEEEENEHQQRLRKDADARASNSSSSSGSDGIGFWEMYLIYNLMTPSAHATPNATMSAVLDAKNTWEDGAPAGLDLPSIQQAMDVSGGLKSMDEIDLSSLSEVSNSLDSVSWDAIDRTIDSVSNSLDSAMSNVSTCSSGSSMSSCSSCGGGGD